jgi:hypothetical protein
MTTIDGNYFESIIKRWCLFCIIPLSGKDTTLGAGLSVLQSMETTLSEQTFRVKSFC